MQQKIKFFTLVPISAVILGITFYLFNLKQRQEAPTSRSEGINPAQKSELSQLQENKFPKNQNTKNVDEKESELIKSLSDQEKREFFDEIRGVFSKLILSSLDKETLKIHLSKLNQRGEAGMNAVVESLEKIPSSDEGIETRLALIDYLVYRSKFDTKSRDNLKILASSPMDPSTPSRYRAVILADKAELVGGLAGLDWTAASKIIGSTQDNLQRTLMISEAYEGIIAKGGSSEYATSLIREIQPDFHPNG